MFLTTILILNKSKQIYEEYKTNVIVLGIIKLVHV